MGFKWEGGGGGENRATDGIRAGEWKETTRDVRRRTTVDNAGGGKCEAKRRAGEVMRSKLGPPRVADVPQIFGTEVRHELWSSPG